MVKVTFTEEFEKQFKKIKDDLTKEKIKKQIKKIVENPLFGKSLKYDLKGENFVY